MPNSNEPTIRKFWTLFDARKFAEVRDLLHEDFVCIWPQSRELIRGAGNFITLNENYPGEWRMEIKRMISKDDIVISEVLHTYKDQKIYAVSLFEFKEGKIIKSTEYWADTYDAPEWRKEWVEKI